MYKKAIFEGSVTRAFVGPLRRALPSLPLPPQLAAALEDSSVDGAVDIQMVGPFPIMTTSASTIRQSGGVAAVAKPAGWRALFVFRETPFAVVDTGLDGKDTGYASVRGSEVAEAFHAALELASDEVRRRKWRATHSIKVLKIPHIYLSALWLAGRPPLFIPTRLGTPWRPACEIWQGRELVGEIARLGRIHARRARNLAASK